MKTRIKCEFCGKQISDGDIVSIPSSSAFKRHAHHHLKCVIRAVVNEAIEECAKIAEGYGDTVNKDQWTITHTMAGARIAEVIRKKGQENQP